MAHQRRIRKKKREEDDGFHLPLTAESTTSTATRLPSLNDGNDGNHQRHQPQRRDDHRRRSRRRRRRRRRDYDDDDEEPFAVLFVKVGIGVLLFGLVTCGFAMMFLRIAGIGGGGDGGVGDEEDDVYDNYDSLANVPPEDGPVPAEGGEEAVTTTLPPFPTFELDDRRAAFDAYGLAESLSSSSSIGLREAEAGTDPSLSRFFDEASRLRDEFATRYGGVNAARYILQKGISTFDDDDHRRHRRRRDDEDATVSNGTNFPGGIVHTAERIRRARDAGRPFKIAFGGYSVTAGRGNRFHQSYPFVLERLLSGPMKLLGVDLEVRNAAIGGIPSFPYGWCLPNFLGRDADVVSWDYSMNEAGGATEGLEAYLRQTTALDRRPMVIVKDTHLAERRRGLLQRYVDEGTLLDPLVVHTDPATEPFLDDLDERLLPIGFQDWRKFGAPPGAPGQARHHPAVKEHELIGWVIAMQLLGAMELMAWSNHGGDSAIARGSILTPKRPISLPAPYADEAYLSTLSPGVSSILFGNPTGKHGLENVTEWVMNSVHCRTSFDPALSGSLDELVVSGTVGEQIDLMLPKGGMFYNKGWVLDLGEAEKKAKRKLERFGGLGYIDTKKAFYGVYASGPLQMFIPCGLNSLQNIVMRDANVNASNCFRSLIVCEVNEKRGESECDIEHDMSFVVGGIEAKKVEIVRASGVSYLGKNLCLDVGIPASSVLTLRSMMKAAKAPTKDRNERLNESFSQKPENFAGISLEISVKSKGVTVKKGACSISHVVWEQVTGNAPGEQ